jgi:hypothetical protein
MSKRNNMGRKSHKVQDIQFKQNVAGLGDELAGQRPSLNKQQANKSSKEEHRNTK